LKQLTQQLKSGHMEILEVPFPALQPGYVLVRNHYSVVSAGTEGKTVSDARKGYIAKARSRQKEVKQVIDLIKTQGFKETYSMVMNKLEAPSALGYSSAGEVIAVGEGVTGFAPGDHVACGGATAVHADVVAVPVNLCVKLPHQTPLQQAAFATIASIAIQGIRQAETSFGETVVVIGLGLIGQIAIQILKAAGIKVIGVDINDAQVQAAMACGANHAYNRNQAGIENIIDQFTKGIGADAVIITAGTSSLDPVNFAGTVARKKGKVVIVGAVPTGFDRKDYYRKELDLRMSSSYGPGRYDNNYEHKGIDYPAGYVRWTENRNMQSYIDLLTAGKLNMEKVITHTFPLENAPEAYAMILEKSQHFSGILIEYDTTIAPKETVQLTEPVIQPSKPVIGLVGAGSFAQNILLPRLNGMGQFVGIATSSGNKSRHVADKYRFSYCTNQASDIFKDATINTVFVLTPHHLHAPYAIQALEAGKHVFVEKPMAMNEDELEKVAAAYHGQPAGAEKMLMLGFNRRFAPFMQKVKNMFLPEQPKAMNFRINAGTLPPEHWVQDPEIGGGRIIGEACHFIDLAMFLAGSPITQVYAQSIPGAHHLNDTVAITLSFENGSIANISYVSNGNKKMPKEHYEIFCDGTAVTIHDFTEMTIYGKHKKTIKAKQDKGHKHELAHFMEAISQGKTCPIPFAESYHTTLATIKTIQSITQKISVRLSTELNQMP